MMNLYITFQALNVLMASIAWWATRERLISYLILLWLGNLLNFSSQVVFENYLLLALGFSTYYIVSCSFVQIIKESLSLDPPVRFFCLSYISGVVLTILISLVTSNFTFISLPVAVVVVIPLFWSVFQIFRQRKILGFFGRFLGVILFLNSLHFLNYPFLRMNEDFAPYGFMIAFSLLYIFSVFLPVFIFKEVGKTYNEKLKTKVTEKTAQLNRALEQQHHQLQELDKLKKQKEILVNTICHDVANPLMVAMIYTKKVHNAEELKALPSAQVPIEKVMKRLDDINKILTQVKEEQSNENKKELSLEKCSFSEIYDEVEDLFQSSLTAKNIKLVKNEKTRHDVFFLANKAALINHVVANIMQNAIKYSPQGSKILIESNYSRHKNLFIISVIDSGEGFSRSAITPDITSTLFENKTGTAGEPSYGLGMEICKSYASKMNGLMTFSNSSEGGGMVSIHLNIAVSELDSEPVEQVNPLPLKKGNWA